METIKKESGTMETMELQLLGSLHKLQCGNKEGFKDVKIIAERVKTSCKSIRAKIEVVEKEISKQTKTEMELKALNSKLESKLNNSKSILEEYLDESWVENDDDNEKKDHKLEWRD